MLLDKKSSLFNLFDTNGRRRDILNAYKIYLDILSNLNAEWDTYPSSTTQFLFYKQAIEASPEVFKKHDNYDKLINLIGSDYEKFISKDSEWIKNNLPIIKESLDTDVEQRARHYTSNLVRIGFADKKRKISPIGYAFSNASAERDCFEKILPIDNINLILLRQMAKLRLYIKLPEDKYCYYSPFFMALYLLLYNSNIDREFFEMVVQGACSEEYFEQQDWLLSNITNTDMIKNSILNNVEYNPLAKELFKGTAKIPKREFAKYIKNQKSSSAVETYYAFYSALIDFRTNQNEDNLSILFGILDSNKATLEKAFGCGKSIFKNFTNKTKITDFLESNKENALLVEETNKIFYEVYLKSKRLDAIKEYADTTVRLLSATGLFKFETKPEIIYKEIFSIIFSEAEVKKNIFGILNKTDMENLECEFLNEASLSQIMRFAPEEIQEKSKEINELLGVTNSFEALNKLKSKNSLEFVTHIKSKYSKETIIELLKLFADRSNDSKIQKAVNDAATVPTIYEYIIAIAWYYVSNEDFDLYESLNLTLNADYEPIVHAGAGKGDIVINYDSEIVMLEVTLMNKQAQKRGEWEPVLRHSLNLKAENEAKETITFFFADELDYNTINIWRAVSAVTLESTDTHKSVDGVIIMPFTNSNLVAFLEKNISKDSVVSATKESFSRIPKISDATWHNEILNSLVT